MKFSLTDDFLSPGEVCIKPIEIKKKPKTKTSVKSEVDFVDSAPLPKASITLQDCLACSGCVTSAESVLIMSQSTKEFETRSAQAKANQELIVVSIAAEARASIAAHFHISLEQAHARLVTLFKSWGADQVLDMDLARRVSLLESKLEFREHFDSLSQGGAAGGKVKKPLLASSCPGWICYAEKAQPQALPFISKVRSAQQVMGRYVKNVLGPKLGAKAVYHVSVMMCYDKKLEATRSDFVEEDIRDVDTVLATSELLEYMVDEKKIDFMSLAEAESIEPLVGDTEGSGAWASAMFRDIALRNFGVKVENVDYKAGRNPDIREAALEVDGKVVLKVGIANGFRNIQNIVRKLKTGTLHYVEIMACPSGCLNGGGQIRVDNPSDRAASKERLKQVMEVYSSIKAGTELAEVDTDLQAFYNVVGASPGSETARKLFYTEYHEVPTSDDLVVTNW